MTAIAWRTSSLYPVIKVLILHFVHGIQGNEIRLQLLQFQPVFTDIFAVAMLAFYILSNKI